jgi:transcriptional regulator with XRE-family HTH domain
MNELEQRWQDLGQFIREQRHLGQMSLRKLSERAGISNPYLSQIERGLRRPSAEILQQIAKALQISAETLYVRAGILDEDTEAPRLVDLIRHDRDLTEDQKRTLITVYESFRATNATALDVVLEAVRSGDLDGGDEPGDVDAATSPTKRAQRPSRSASTDASPSR